MSALCAEPRLSDTPDLKSSTFGHCSTYTLLWLGVWGLGLGTLTCSNLYTECHKEFPANWKHKTSSEVSCLSLGGTSQRNCYARPCALLPEYRASYLLSLRILIPAILIRMLNKDLSVLRLDSGACDLQSAFLNEFHE